MENIESTIVELGSIFQELAHMVKEQEEQIERFGDCHILVIVHKQNKARAEPGLLAMTVKPSLKYACNGMISIWLILTNQSNTMS